MPSLLLNGRPCAYTTAGEGFPLILVPDAGGTLSDWAQSMPLLGELCRVVAYEYTSHTPTLLLPLPGQGEGRGEGRQQVAASPLTLALSPTGGEGTLVGVGIDHGAALT